MSAVNLTDHLACEICLDIADEAVESNCCHHIFCGSCLRHCPSCPACRASPLIFSPSFALRRIIGNLPAECPYDGCCVNVTRATLVDHQLSCPHGHVACPVHNCTARIPLSSLIAHLVEVHKLKSTNETGHNGDPLAKRYNEDGVGARLGSTGKYYCRGRIVDGSSDGRCGPTNGPNCPACMKLDITARKLPTGYLVNKDGFTARKGQTGKFYCGRRVMINDPTTDGYCGPTNGANCPACRHLDETQYIHS